MRLWPLSFIPHLPRQQLLGQHRECCAMRGLGWGRKHSTVDYVFKHPLAKLAAYHQAVIAEMEHREYKVEQKWKWFSYRGKRAPIDTGVLIGNPDINPHYPEQNAQYVQECIENLKRKGVNLNIA